MSEIEFMDLQMDYRKNGTMNCFKGKSFKTAAWYSTKVLSSSLIAPSFKNNLLKTQR